MSLQESNVEFRVDNHLGVTATAYTVEDAAVKAKEIDAVVIDVFKDGKFLTSLIKSSVGDNRWVCPLL